MSAFAEEILVDVLTRLIEHVSPKKRISTSTPHHFVAAVIATNAAHAAEILLKSAIASEHPLLLFESKGFGRRPPTNEHLELQHLFERETIPLKNLPYALWASTSYRIPEPELFEDFRRLRNKIEHLGPPPDEVVIEKTLYFLFSIVDPILRHFWSNDLLNLIRPYYIDEYVNYIRNLAIQYELPGWYEKFNSISERDELDAVKSMARFHYRAAESSGSTVTRWFFSMSAIVPDDRVCAARREVIRITGNQAERNTFTVPLSPAGSDPATYYGAHTAATEDIALRLVALMHRHSGYYMFSEGAIGSQRAPQGSFDELCQALGLKRIQPMV